MKKFLLSALALVAVAALAITGTIAYLQWEDEDVNVMTLGNVKIAQHEYQRADGVAYNAGEPGLGNGIKTGELEEFEQNQALYPAVPKNGLATDYSAEATDLFFWGDYVYSGTAGNGLWNDNKLSNVMDKMVFVENTGSSDCYFRTYVAFECPVGMEYSEGADKEFMMNINGSSLYKWENLGYHEADGVRYLVMEATYLNVLKPGQTAHPSLLQVVMTHNATNEDMELLGDTYEIIVLSQAVQAAGFEDAEQAVSTLATNVETETVPAAVVALNTSFGEADDVYSEATYDTNVEAWINGAREKVASKQVDTWDGTADTSWYNDTDAEFVIMTAEQLAGLAELVNGGNTFDGKTVKLGKDISLYCEDTTPAADGDPITFRPIGDHSKDGTFEGTFDGNGKTISNLYQNGWDLGYQWGAYGSYGLFGNLNNATVKNLTLSGGESLIEGGDVSFVAGSATGTCVFENITIKDSIAATYNNGCGGIIGWSGAGEYTFKNITIAEDAVLAGLWGSFDSSIGGIVGQGEPGATYNFENVDIACRIDAYNDCTASYDYYNYRMCGMIIGRLEETTTIDGSNYPDTSKYNITCNDVEVIYGDWANYHYCRATGERAKRVEAGYSYGGVAADYDHSVCTAHHMELIAFDQIFGGDQYAVKGLKSYDGVTVVYNNK